MLYFNKYFKIPGPKDLGMSDSNHAMPMDFFCNEDDFTWEDYYKEVKKRYPIKYFLSCTVPSFFIRMFNMFFNPISDFKYWFKSHTYKRYHILDLRQPKIVGGVKNIDYYRWGWLDSDSKMLFAIFNILNNFVKNELDHLYFPTEYEVKNEPSLLAQRKLCLEILFIHLWWNEERLLEKNNIEKLSNEWHELKKNKLPEAEVAWAKLQKAEEDFENKTDEMIARLMKIRRSMWS